MTSVTTPYPSPMRRRVVLLALLIVTAACTPGSDEPTSTTESLSGSTTRTVVDPSTSSSSTTEPPDGLGGELVIGQQESIASLNPFAPDFFGGRVAGNLVWATIYDIEPGSWSRVPDAVTVLPSRGDGIELNDDGTMTVRYEVRSGARWSDGLPITGEDLAFTAEAMRDLAVRGVGNVDPVMATVVATDAVDRLAFITFERPTLAFEDALWIILPSHALEGVDLVDGTDGTDWPSGGPFVVDSFDPFVSVRFVRNDFYGRSDEQGRGLPYLDAVTITQTTEEGFQANEPVSPAGAFVGRELDIAVLNLWPEDIDRARNAEGSVVELVPTPVIEHVTFQFGPGRETVTVTSGNDELDYRRAVAHAIDRNGLLDETGVPWFDDVPGLLRPVGPSAWDRYGFDPEEGGALVDGVFGDATGRLVPSSQLFTTGNGDYRIRIGDALESRFAAIGAGYEPVYQDSVLFFGETLSAGTFDLGMWAWISDGGYASTVRMIDLFDPTAGTDATDFGRWYADGGGDSVTTENGNTYSELAEQARTTVDPERFAVLVSELEELLADQVPIIPLFHRAAAFAWWPDVVTGIVPNGSTSSLTWNAEVWQRIGE